MIAITPLYAVPLVALFLILSWRVIAERRSNRIAYGDNDSPRVQAKIRAQANWSEYTPITLLLILTAELQGASVVMLHLTGLILLVGRTLHGYGMSFAPRQFTFRRNGMILTLLAILIGLVLNVFALF